MVEDVARAVGATLFLQGDEMVTRRKALCETTFPFFFERLQNMLLASSGAFFAGEHLTVADLKVCVCAVS